MIEGRPFCPFELDLGRGLPIVIVTGPLLARQFHLRLKHRIATTGPGPREGLECLPAITGRHQCVEIFEVAGEEARRRRSEERRVGKECVSTCRSRWSTYH